jgi:hypothetical protein
MSPKCFVESVDISENPIDLFLLFQTPEKSNVPSSGSMTNSSDSSGYSARRSSVDFFGENSSLSAR